MEYTYLTAEKKIDYMNDFNEHVLKSTAEYWRLDSGLAEILININSNQLVQTLYSKNYNKVQKVSYLMIAIDKDYQKKLDFIVKIMDNTLNGFIYGVEEPTEFENNEVVEMGCNTNINHFNISVFCLWCNSTKIKDHKEFWSFLHKNLVD